MTGDPNDRTTPSAASPSAQEPQPPRGLEASGRTVGEAIEQGLASLGLDRSRVEIDILDEGSRGILGLGGREARVRLTVRSGTAGTVGAVARELLSLMGVSAEVSAEEGPESIRVNLEGADVGPLIGKHGQTLGALETLLGLMVGRKSGTPVRVELDAEGYRERRQASLEDLARRTAERAARQGREVALIPMGSRDRRIIHMVLQDHPQVSTVSRGERDMRRVVIVPKGGEGRKSQPDYKGQPGPVSEPSREEEAPYESQPDGPQGNQTARFGDQSGSRRARPPRRQPGGEGGRRPPRTGAARGFGKRSQLQGPPSPKGPRPDGLPSDEELEAEIEAYLAKTNPENSKGSRSAPGAEDAPKPSAQEDLPEEKE